MKVYELIGKLNFLFGGNMPPGMHHLLILRRSFGAYPFLQSRSSRVTRQTSNKDRNILLYEETKTTHIKMLMTSVLELLRTCTDP